MLSNKDKKSETLGPVFFLLTFLVFDGIIRGQILTQTKVIAWQLSGDSVSRDVK